jgi:hypothetical protein
MGYCEDSCGFRPDYYCGWPHSSVLDAVFTAPVDSLEVPSVGGSATNGPSWLEASDAVSTVKNAGIPAAIITAGEQFGYLPAWTPTASAGFFAIGMSAIFVRKQYHERITIVNGVDIESMWGVAPGFGLFTLDVSQLDGDAVLG